MRQQLFARDNVGLLLLPDQLNSLKLVEFDRVLPIDKFANISDKQYCFMGLVGDYAASP